MRIRIVKQNLPFAVATGKRDGGKHIVFDDENKLKFVPDGIPGRTKPLRLGKKLAGSGQLAVNRGDLVVSVRFQFCAKILDTPLKGKISFLRDPFTVRLL